MRNPFKKFLDLMRGGIANQRTQYIPIGTGNTRIIDSRGDIVFTTCIEILSKQLAQTRWSLYGGDNDEVWEKYIDELEKQFSFILNQQPYPGINAFDFWGYMEKQRLSTGNAVAYLDFDKLGRLQHVVPLDGSHVSIYWDNNNIFGGARKLIYEYMDNVSGSPRKSCTLKRFPLTVL